jgi:hypothetical protein
MDYSFANMNVSTGTIGYMGPVRLGDLPEPEPKRLSLHKIRKSKNRLWKFALNHVVAGESYPESKNNANRQIKCAVCRRSIMHYTRYEIGVRYNTRSYGIAHTCTSQACAAVYQIEIPLIINELNWVFHRGWTSKSVKLLIFHFFQEKTNLVTDLISYIWDYFVSYFDAIVEAMLEGGEWKPKKWVM